MEIESSNYSSKFRAGNRRGNLPKKRLLKKLTSSLSKYYKEKIVYRLFWGRSNLSRKFVHGIFFVLTVTVILTGFSNTIFSQQDKNSTITAKESLTGNVDLLEQGSNIQSILLAATTNNFQIFEYKIQAGDTFESIAEKYNITVESLKLSNLDKNVYYLDKPKEGDYLRVPEINGVLVRAKDLENIETFMARVTRGNKQDVIEVNNLRGPDFSIAKDSFVLVPDGAVAPPPAPVTNTYIYDYSNPVASYPIPSPSEAVLNGVYFIDPLYNCGGYSYSRGFSSWHNGADLAKYGGCWIGAAAAGTVDYAGWSPNGEGFMVRLNHGNGIQTLYFHGDGQFAVKPGDSVTQGQLIMYMGCTGYCTGTHLHFSLRLNGAFIDPAPYVPYWRP